MNKKSNCFIGVKRYKTTPYRAVFYIVVFDFLPVITIFIICYLSKELPVQYLISTVTNVDLYIALIIFAIWIIILVHSIMQLGTIYMISENGISIHYWWLYKFFDSHISWSKVKKLLFMEALMA